MLFKEYYYQKTLQILFYFFPLSFIAGSITTNINTILFILIGVIYVLTSKINIKYNFVNISLFLFFLTLIVSSFLNLNIIGQENFIKSFLLLRFFFLFILIEALILNKKIKLKYFFYACYFVSIFLSLDLALQFFYGKNIFGFEPWEGRITGLFQDEAVAGAFIQKLFFFVLIFFLIFVKKENKFKHIIILLSLILIIFASFIASNRISFFILIIGTFLILIFFKAFRKKLIVSLVILIPLFYNIYQNDAQTKNRYKTFVNKILTFKVKETNLEISNSKISKKEMMIKKDAEKVYPDHLKIYLTSYISFQEKKLFGNGLKSFRYKCKNFLNIKNTLCSTHPHNFHLEILHDSGLIGIFFISLFSFGLLLRTIKLLISKKLILNQKIVLSLIIFNFLIEIFPFKSTGSFFTTWNSTILWVSISLMNYQIYKNYNEKNKLL